MSVGFRNQLLDHLAPVAVLAAMRRLDGAVEDFAWRFANHTACAALGVDGDALIHSTLRRTADGVDVRSDTDAALAAFRRVSEILAVGRKVEPGRHLGDLELPGPFMSRWERALQAAIDGGERVVFDHTAPGDIARHVELAVAPVTTGSLPDGTVTTIRDVTDHVRREQTLVSLARRDPLTGLDNRSEVTHELERALAAAGRTGRPVALLSVDLDSFKFINDSFGHHVGDELLQAAADRLRTVVRGGDLLSRTGGDEFVVVCRDLRRADDALRSAWRIVEAFRAPFPIRDAEVVTTASVGVAVSSGNDTVDEVVEQADAAVYAAKAAGRDTVATFDSVLQSEVDRRHQIEVDLRAAVAGGGVGPSTGQTADQLELWFQPAYRLATGEITGAEALLRWRHPSGGVWEAGAFVDVAEDAGLLADQSARILDLACASAADWPATPSGDRVSVRVNLSPRQLADHGLLHRVDDALRSSGLDPGLLCVEVAETSLSRTSRAVGPNLDGLAERGVSPAFDNFGSGYASLTQLQDFPVDVVKLDRSCTTAVVRSERARNVSAGTNAAAERRGSGAIADGVETERQAAVLARLGYRFAQGFASSPAVPGPDLANLIRHPPIQGSRAGYVSRAGAAEPGRTGAEVSAAVGERRVGATLLACRRARRQASDRTHTGRHRERDARRRRRAEPDRVRRRRRTVSRHEAPGGPIAASRSDNDPDPAPGPERVRRRQDRDTHPVEPRGQRLLGPVVDDRSDSIPTEQAPERTPLHRRGHELLLAVGTDLAHADLQIGDRRCRRHPQVRRQRTGEHRVRLEGSAGESQTGAIWHL